MGWGWAWAGHEMGEEIVYSLLGLIGRPIGGPIRTDFRAFHQIRVASPSGPI